MVQPIDYLGLLPQVDIGQSLLSGVQAGSAFRQAIDQRKAREAAQQRQEQFSADLQNALANGGDARVWAEMTAKYPDMRQAFKQAWELNSQDQRDAEFGAGTQVYSALRQDRPDVAIRTIDENIEALRNSGRDTKSLESIRSQIQRDPKSATGYVGLVLSSLEPEKWKTVIETDISAGKAPYEIQKAGAEATQADVEARDTPERLYLSNLNTAAGIRNIDSQIAERSNRLNLDRDRLQSDTEAKLYELGQKQGQLDGDAKKLVNDSVIGSVASDQAASRALDLAERLKKEGGGYGVASTAGEWLKRATGQQDALSSLRKEYIRLRNAQAIKDLPPGVATDKDVSLALEGFPDPSADAGTISSFLRGVAKMNQVAAVSENAKAEWVNSVGHLGKARSDINIDGVNVPAGTTFTDFSRSYIDKKAQQRGAEQTQSQVQNRSYMRFANPGAQ